MAEDKKVYGGYKRRPCNARMDMLAKPKKRIVLSVWDNYAAQFPPEKKEALRLLLQELYAMTPEETQTYFDEISKIMKKLAARERMRKKQLKRYRAKKRRIERRCALQKFRRILINALTYASKHPVPPLVSPRLRNMADVILDQICDIRGLDVPQRTDIGRLSQFLFNIADWIAIAIEQIYYETHVHKNQELDLLAAQFKVEMEAKTSRKGSTKKSKKSSTQFTE